MALEKFILFPLVAMILLTSFYALYQIQPLSLTGTTNYNTQNIDGTQMTNGTSTTYEQTGTAYNITLTQTLGFMAILAIIEVIATIAGIRVVGSGISDTTVQIIYKSAGFIILWSMLSVTGLQILGLIPYSMGLLLYLIMTLGYAYGIISSVGMGNGS